MEENRTKVIAMYEISGIQDYIFRTAKVKDVIGASYVVEKIIQDALENAVSVYCAENAVSLNNFAQLEWRTDGGPLAFCQINEQIQVQVLYIGGGNAYIMYACKSLCIAINRIMAKYILDKTYSLKLTVAVHVKSDNYNNDFAALRQKMTDIKAETAYTKLLGALPVMGVELKTGYPLVTESESRETILKKEAERPLRESMSPETKKFESYITQKGQDSELAVVHIDGNNMGTRINDMLKGINDYQQAVSQMREISFQIDSCYKNAFYDMKAFFQKESGKQKEFNKKATSNFVLEIVAAGDDITYVCNAKIALATVEYFCRHISAHTMNGKYDEESIRKYGFSACAGIAYIGGHFPFYIAYDVAEACCESAKKYAKEEKHRDKEHIGSWVDFHICKNIQARDFKMMRKREYITNHGECLINRPYMIRTNFDGKLSEMIKAFPWHDMDKLKQYISYFTNEENIPKSYAKQVRNTYPLGRIQTNTLNSFLRARNWQMPDSMEDMFYIEDGKAYAKWYDALEISDNYIGLEEITEGADDKKV